MAEIRENVVVDGRYRILSRIGSGGMADVWLAEDTHLHRRVALKVLHNRFAQDSEFVARFKREAESAAGLQHPNVVGIFDRGDAEGTYYIAMEFLDGRSLKELIDAGLRPNEAVALVRQILEAARFAHRHQIVHRDFKPQNVIVNSEGKATVTDFGIARAGVSEITQTGSVMGTAHYLSPEQAQGLDVTPTSDLYSIGVILYEALTGRVPFEADSAVAIALKQVSQTPQRPSTLNPEVSPALDAVVMRALEKDSQRRFQDADAFIDALDAAQLDPGGGVLPPVPGSQTAPFAPLPPSTSDEERLRREEEQRRRRLRIWTFIAIAVLLGALAGLALTRDTTTEVPAVAGFQLAVAQGQLEEDGFKVGEITYVNRDDAPQDKVIETDPGAGQTSLDCSLLSFFCDKPEIDLTVSAGPGNAVVPVLAGESEDVAVRRLEEAGLEPAIVRRSSDLIDEGFVIRTDPPAGETVRRTDEVEVVVSSGLALVRVPNVVGDQRAAAEGDLLAAGLGVSVTEREDPAPAGEVLTQSPKGGDEVEEETTVFLTVSSGVPEVTVPDVLGDQRRDAVLALQDLGLDVVVDLEDTSDQTENGIVLDQDPAAGTRLQERDQVTIVVGHFVAAEEPPPNEQGTPRP